MKTNSIHVMALWAATLGAGLTCVSCTKEASQTSSVSAADSATKQKADLDKKAAADKAAADKIAADKIAADKSAAANEAAAKAVADKVASDKAAAEKSATHAKDEAASLPTDLVEAKAEVARTLAQVDLTMAKLDALSTATGDLDKPSESALAAIQSLEGEFKSLKKRGDEMRDRGAKYFEAWEKALAAMSTPEVAAIATKRKDELSKKYAEVLTAMQESRAALDAYWGDMKTIHKAVDDDLTPETQKLLVAQVKTAKEKAATLKIRVEATSAKLNDVSLLYTKP